MEKQREQLHNFLLDYLPGCDLSLFLQCFGKREIRKGRFYVTPGKACENLAFIEKGSFRVYYYDVNGKEITTWFSFEGMVITDLLAFYTGNKATFYAEAIENSVIWMVTKQQLTDLYEKVPAYKDFGWKFAEEALVMLMQSILSAHIKTAEERYLDLLNQTDLVRRVPLKYIASYLGITDTSLSRLRRKIR